MADISYGSIGRDILFHILRYSTKEIGRLSNVSLCYVEGTHPLIWQKFPLIWQWRIPVKVPVQCYVNVVIEISLQVLAICLAQVLAGRWIYFEGLAFASKAILGKICQIMTFAKCQLCLPYPMNNSKNFGKGLIIPLRLELYENLHVVRNMLWHYSNKISTFHDLLFTININLKFGTFSSGQKFTKLMWYIRGISTRN